MSTTTNSTLSLPFRRSAQLSLAAAIRQYINSDYDQHPDMFKQDLEAIDELRRDAINVREAHSSGIKKLQAYAGQLVWIGGKFPIDIGAEFAWYPALGYNTERPLVRNNMKYELLNVLYNLAALYSKLAISSPRTTAEGLKAAANYFSLAAGVLYHMQSEILPDLRMSSPPEDMDSHTLESLVQLFLAQSQECFWQRAVVEGLKDNNIARLAARASDLYNLAAEAAMKSEAISSSWIHHMAAKHHHFAAAAQLRAAYDCLDKRRYGEEVARLKDAVLCATEGLKETKGAYLSMTVVDDLNSLKKKAEEDLKRSEKDNDLIFLNPVPLKSELRKLERFNMAKIVVPPQVDQPYQFLGDGAEFGPALFSRLVPFSVYVAISIYEERRDRVVNQNIIQELELLADKIHLHLSSAGLPGSLQALEKPLGLPPSLVQRAEELRQGDAVGRVQKSLADIDKLRLADLTIFEEGRTALVAEDNDDSKLRAKYGIDRWTRPNSRSDPQGAKLWDQAREIEGYFESSMAGDNSVKQKFAENEQLLRVLCGPDRGLMEYVPSSAHRETNNELKISVAKLRSAYNDVLRLESRRRKKAENLRDAARRDDIKPDILAEVTRLERANPDATITPAHFEDMIEKRLDRLYEHELKALDEEVKEQGSILNQLDRAHLDFLHQKSSMDGRQLREREQALQKLDSAYFKYKEIVNNLEVGRKFYNDLSKIVGQGFRDVIKAWVAQRAIDARVLEERLIVEQNTRELVMPPLSRLNLSHNGSQLINPELASFNHSQPAVASGESVSELSSSLQPSQGSVSQQLFQGPIETAPQHQSHWDMDHSMQQPQPVLPLTTRVGGTWNPATGIKFGGPAVEPAAVPGEEQSSHRQRGESDSTIWKPDAGIKFG